MINYEQDWQFIRRFDPDDPRLNTLVAKEITSIKNPTEIPDPSIITSQLFSYAVQTYERTDLIFNGSRVWQGRGDPTAWIVKALVPIQTEYGQSFDQDGVTIQTIRNRPVPESQSTQLGWKITHATDFSEISDGYAASDLFRGWKLPLRKHPHILEGFIQGGNCPAQGDYFNTWQDHEDSIYYDQIVTIYPTRFCEHVGYPNTLPIPVTTVVDMVDLIDKAEQACINEDLDMGTVVIEFIVDRDENHPTGSLYLARGYACCE